MLKHKRKSTAIETAQFCIATLKAIDPNLDLGEGVTLENYEQLIQETRNDIEQYNTAVSVAEQTSKSIKEKENAIVSLGKRILLGLAFKLGKKSKEYLMLANALKEARRRFRNNNGTGTETEATPAVTEEKPA